MLVHRENHPRHFRNRTSLNPLLEKEGTFLSLNLVRSGRQIQGKIQNKNKKEKVHREINKTYTQIFILFKLI